jgi:hypothetical protein
VLQLGARKEEMKKKIKEEKEKRKQKIIKGKENR